MTDLRGRRPVSLGITRLLESERGIIEGARIGLIANSASRDESGIPTASVLLSAGIKLKRLFSPEHGFDATAAAGEPVADATDPLTGLPVRSLYGKTREPDEEKLSDLDVILFDLQDIGVRCYTYIWTMALVMKAAAVFGKTVVVLDRPNPIGGVVVQGPLLEAEFASFLGMYPIPLRHGMTTGELALLFNRSFGIGCHLAVVKMSGWRRRLHFSDTGLDWTPPSPAIVSPETAHAYAGTCLLEGTNISEGRGTSSPFRLIGAPWLDQAIIKDLNEKWTTGLALSLQRFTPTASKYKDEACVGISLKVIDKESADPLAFTVEFLSKALACYGERFEWNEKHFDALAGTNRLRQGIVSGRQTEEILKTWTESLRSFEKLRTQYLLYEG